MQYDKIEDSGTRKDYLKVLQNLKVFGDSPTLEVASGEISRAYMGLLQKDLRSLPDIRPNSVVLGTKEFLLKQEL
ncbi:alpha-glucuronidase family glycosyl hydrolase [Antarcticibacterium sp. 1MA-6-2]|uniref:alpha-glucuronidase family glycosyl hydrolase n=1 Tax=Antarcticibacterium sp. 1MA-6-2 TaxID=2908210 RepID=UPI00210227DF|nr:alpha-glucuronidase family glycosyl hydrolase [Antarcticibacterium sp. 1MA-6-2]